ncbi:MAG: translation initiation factor IF-2 [Anaerovoracaceae bacterium]
MSMRVYELAKSLNLSNKELMNRLNKMGIETKSHMKNLSDSECSAVKEALEKAKNTAEIKTEKTPAKNQSSAQNREQQKARKPEGARNEKKAEASSAPSSYDGRPQRTGQKNERRFTGGDAEGRSPRPSRSGNEGRPGDAKKKDFKNQGNRSGSGDRRPRTDQPSRTDRSAGRPDRNERTERSDRGERRPAAGARPAPHINEGPAADQKQQRRDARTNRDNKDRSRRNGADSDNNSKRRNGNGDKKTGRPNMMKLSKPQHSHKKDLRKEQRKEAARKAEEELAALPAGAIVVTVPITVKGLSEQIDISTSQIIMTLMKMGIMANINQNLDEDTVQILGDELGKTIIIGKVEEEDEEEGIEHFEDREEDLRPRPPIITVMGHVDHGKTSLLDRIRKTSVTESESGGITQHIGASEIVHNGQRIVFLDTPGHEAFTAMRARGAYVTDIAVLVVAADDSVKPQTIEAISHAKAAAVPIIVAINKIDKPGANVDNVRKDLSENGILVEDWGGDVICVPVSAKTGEGIDTLLEMILLQAEMLELKANPSRLALGSVIEARLDKQRGPVATLLILNGTLHAGMSIVAGNCSGRIKAMTNFRGETLKKAGPATAVEILGLTEVPEAGDEFNAVSSDKVAREIAENRKQKQREQIMQKTAGVTLDQLFSQIEQGSLKELNLIIKADVQGSVGALVSSLEKLRNEEVAVKIIHTGVGTITESDVMLASTTGAIIIGFNVRPVAAVQSVAARDGVEIRTYSVIYEAIEDVEQALKGMLDPEYVEQVIGTVEVRNTFKVPNVGIIAGAYVLTGKVERNAGIRLVREGIVIHEGKISSLKRFKDDAKEVNHGFECGIGIENYNDIKEGDIIEAFKMVEVERK